MMAAMRLGWVGFAVLLAGCSSTGGSVPGEQGDAASLTAYSAFSSVPLGGSSDRVAPRVAVIDSARGQCIVTLGARCGVSVGSQFDVVRKQAKVVCRLVAVAVHADSSVCIPDEGFALDSLVAGDRVALDRP